MTHADEGALAQHSFHQLTFYRRAALQRVHNGHGYLAFTQVAGHRLAQNFFRGGEVQHVIHDLEGHAQAASVVAHALFFLFGGPGQDRTHAHAHGEQAGGLPVDQIEVLVERDTFSQLFNLQELAFDHLLGQVNEHVQDAEVTFLHRDFESLHVEPVAGQHALGVPPLRVGRRTSAPRLGFVNNVVVHERRRVDDFYHCAQPHGPAPGVSEELGGKQQQRRTDSFSTAGAQVLADLRDRRDVRDRVASELLFDGGNVVTEEVEDFFPVDGGRRAQCPYCSVDQLLR